MGPLCLARAALAAAAKHSAARVLRVPPLCGAPPRVIVRRYSREGDDDVAAAAAAARFACYQLPHRTVLRVRGEDTRPFLQGIITNDVELLEEPGLAALYSHMLNVQGRTLYDVMLYR